jgi:hypothetical protein
MLLFGLTHGPAAGSDAAVMLTPTVAQTPQTLSDDAGSLVPTLTTETGRVRLAVSSGLVISNVVAPLEEQARIDVWPHLRAVLKRALLLLRILPCARHMTCQIDQRE